MNIHELIKEQTELATTYADDGAFHTAARVFNQLANKLIEHANWCESVIKDINSDNTLS